MRLKSLELQGFKSFPDKTVLTFGDGITAIVGPNGSGKSNISDAVRWVLGEQSTKTLRGSKMEDVIFGGTQKRGPVGYAQVSLTIDNSDGVLPTEYNEVTITRRYYRSGDSEFYINRSAVRLRDIHELLMDTGLGRDGYSIIGQGRIDEILSLKSEDRREIFEEASGISKFRHRKEESEKKLAATEENLVRIRDIISELESQVEPLAKQAEQARRYLKIFEELKELEINVWMHNLDKIYASADKLHNDYQIANSQFERGQAYLDELYAEVEKISEQMRTKDVEMERARERYHEAERSMRDVEREISVLKTTIVNNEENIARITQEVSDEEGRAGGIAAQITEREHRIKVLKARESELQNDILALNERIQGALQSSDDLSTRLDALRAKKSEIESIAANARIARGAAIAELESLKNRQGQINDDLVEREKSLHETEEHKREVNAALREAEETCASVGNILAGCELKRKKRADKLSAVQDQYLKISSSMQAMQHKLQMLNDMERDYEGFSHAVKSIMRAGARGEIAGMHGAISKLIRVPEEYTVAIETILGGALQNIVVEDERAAKAGISFLKSTNGGRATFLPLTTIRGNRLNEPRLAQEPGFIGLGSDLISHDDRYRNIFENLLGRIVVVDHINNASNIARKFSYRFRMVTLDGQVINAGGSYTGGSVSRNAGLLSRANEIARLKEEIGIQGTQLKGLENDKIHAEREYNALKYETEVYENDKRKAEDVLLRAKTELSHFNILLENVSSSIESLQKERELIGKHYLECENKKTRLDEQIAEQEKRLFDLNGEEQKLVFGHSERLRERGTLSDQLSELRMEATSAGAEGAELSRALEELKALRDALAGDHEHKRALIEEYHQKNENIQKRIAEHNEQVSDFLKQMEDISSEIKSYNEEKLNLEGLRNKKDKESKDKNDEILNLERERSRLESKKAGVEQEQRQITDKLWDTYELTISAAKALSAPLDSVAEQNARIYELKAERKKLGTVNVGAIEEYDRVSERFEFLSKQRDDLEKSKDELTRMIGEITEQMRDIFAEQFIVINENFGETFSEIFGGGRAELVLDDPSDILNCGIEIKVQPPGKTLRTITLLSGGERAFVAIALYFAIMKVRPTPFCVLDEIEAALDDVNVARYAAYLRKLTATTQFIVITHRRGTMEESDVLYGVTMQEQGVSKMLTISIAEVERELNIKLK